MAEVKFFWNFLCLKKLVSSCPVLCISIVLSGSYSSGCWGRQQAKSCTKILMAFIIRFIHPVRILMSWTAAGSANNINPVQEYPCIRCIHWLDFSLGLSGSYSSVGEKNPFRSSNWSHETSLSPTKPMLSLLSTPLYAISVTVKWQTSTYPFPHQSNLLSPSILPNLAVKAHCSSVACLKRVLLFYIRKAPIKIIRLLGAPTDETLHRSNHGIYYSVYSPGSTPDVMNGCWYICYLRNLEEWLRCCARARIGHFQT